MEQLSSYLLNQINEASVSLPGDVDQKMNEYLKKIEPEIKRFENAAKSKFREVTTATSGTRAIRRYTCYPKRNEVKNIAWDTELAKFIENPGKWHHESGDAEYLGRGYYAYREKFYLNDGDVHYTMAFQSNFKEIEGSVSLDLWISYPISITSEELKFVPNYSDKTKDIANRPIKVGDSVAYASRAVSGNNPIPVGVVTEVSPKRITVYDKINNNLVEVPGFKCCVIDIQ